MHVGGPNSSKLRQMNLMIPSPQVELKNCPFILEKYRQSSYVCNTPCNIFLFKTVVVTMAIPSKRGKVFIRV